MGTYHELERAVNAGRDVGGQLKSRDAHSLLSLLCLSFFEAFLAFYILPTLSTSSTLRLACWVWWWWWWWYEWVLRAYFFSLLLLISLVFFSLLISNSCARHRVEPAWNGYNVPAQRHNVNLRCNVHNLSRSFGCSLSLIPLMLAFFLVLTFALL